MMDIQYLGNQELLKLQKTAFLASNTIPIEMVLKCYDWASGKHDGHMARHYYIDGRRGEAKKISLPRELVIFM